MPRAGTTSRTSTHSLRPKDVGRSEYVCCQGQSQPLHDHPDQDKFYLVLSGTGLFTVGDATKICGELELILAPAGIPHGVRNESDAMLTFLTVIAPFPRG